MTTLRSWLTAFALVAASVLPATAAPVVADVQIVQTGDRAWVVRIRASEAQAFDVAPSTQASAPFVVRLHRATLSAARAPLGPVPFGNLILSEDAEGIEVRVTLADAGLQVKAAQGESPDVVLLTVAAD